MVFPWIKLTTSSLNAGLATTVSGTCTYFLLGGENRGEKDQIDAIHLLLKQEEEKFKAYKEKLEKSEAVSLEKAKADLSTVQEIGRCLEESQKTFETETEGLNFWDTLTGKIVTFKWEDCKR